MKNPAFSGSRARSTRSARCDSKVEDGRLRRDGSRELRTSLVFGAEDGEWWVEAEMGEIQVAKDEDFGQCGA